MTTGDRNWRFDVRLLSNIKLSFPLERYAWVRLGKPNIDGIGERFVNEIGKDHCAWRYTEFLRRYWGLTENVVEPMDFKLRRHLDALHLDDWSESQLSFRALPESIKSVIFFRTYEIMAKYRLTTNCPEFGRYSYMASKDIQPEYHMKQKDRISLISQLVLNLD